MNEPARSASLRSALLGSRMMDSMTYVILDVGGVAIVCRVHAGLLYRNGQILLLYVFKLTKTCCLQYLLDIMLRSSSLSFPEEGTITVRIRRKASNTLTVTTSTQFWSISGECFQLSLCFRLFIFV